MHTSDETAVVIGDRGDSFGNETEGLGASAGPRAWTLREFPPTEGNRLAVLATDGIADDLRPERLAEFCDWLMTSFAPLEPIQRYHRLASELRAWPTPGHVDDKTIAAICATVEPKEGRI